MPLGKARTIREGHDLTVVTYGRLVWAAKQCAEKLAEDGIEAEVLDLRSLHPFDWDAISESARRTGRVLFANEDTEITNFGEHLLRRAVEDLMDDLVARPRLHAGKHLPGIGLAPTLEYASVPTGESLEEAMRSLAAASDNVGAGAAPRKTAPKRQVAPHFSANLGLRETDFSDVFGHVYGGISGGADA